MCFRIFRAPTTGRLFSALLCLFVAGVGQAGPREQAKRLHDRLAGVPPSEAVLSQMATAITDGDAVGAAYLAMESPTFFTTTLREFATPWTNRDQSVYAELNDMTGTIIGMVRDDVPFDQVLYEDIVYRGADGVVGDAYAQDNNNHYRALQQQRINLGDPALFVRDSQSALPGSVLAAANTAGVMTTRGFAESFLVAGTNRAAVRFAMLNFMCLDQEQLRDVTAWPDRVRQDVDRSPGGDSSIFLNDCLPCHAGLDGLSGAFAFYDFDEDAQQIAYTEGAVQPKFLRDAQVFRYGYETVGDSWINYWRTGPNSYIGWNGPGSGSGAKSMGMELAQTRQFAECQTQQVFEQVCFRSPNGAADSQAVQTLADSFENNNRNMRRLFAETAVHCMGE